MGIITTKGVSYIYGVGTPFEMRALDNVCIDIEKGEIVAIIGHTGSGKSTLIQHLNALLSPHDGTVLFDGKDINENKKSVYDIKFKVGLCFQYPEYQIFESTVAKDIAFGPTNMGLSPDEVKESVANAMRFVGLSPSYADRSPFELSGGEKRRVAVAGVMAMNPEVLILDEPTAGLDPRGKKGILKMIHDYRDSTGKTVIIVSHSMEDVAELATKILVMNKGHAEMYGTVPEIFSRADEITKMGLTVPQVTEICTKLKSLSVNLPDGIFTEKQAAEALFKAAKGGDRK